MSSVKKSALVAFSADQMFSLVADIESYPQFLPWCGGARIMEKGEGEVLASVDIAYHGINKTFTTRNRLQQGKTIEMRLVDGPFKKLHGYWLFESLDESTSKITLDLEFEYTNPLMKLTLGPVFNTVATTLVDHFQQRAVQLYG